MPDILVVLPPARAGRPTRAAPDTSNRAIAAALEEVARLLEEQRANPFRVQAYRHAAATVRGLRVTVRHLLDGGGIDALEQMPGIGARLARMIQELAATGRLELLDRLRGGHDPVGVLGSVPGVGHTLAERVHERLGIASLADLEAAAHDGRLRTVPGFGAKRIEGVRAALAERLGRGRTLGTAPEPDVRELLDVDREYRERAAAGDLPRIAPRRFNPKHEAWLPVLHTTRGDRHYTALYSNTARAHRLGATRDWLVIYHDGARGEHASTVVTARYGPMEGRRVVRGREAECLALEAALCTS
ncbi:DNA polymerase domain-containing protein (plasmid) [Gemmatirosa kalamazoonensis]|uniref:DNA polymerase domain-containing protein n=1 Tax=Gemmatirosa kalamazoonensis TaxID=861299 RepID=W0RSL9_9BACT|nr:helix-hairpin-helix domain-containing protein [Gemmatirosa kalamazoonensis]AHG92583.1 DNA polymerase domain-containing protein [Gemmatirosa kalamazoonensis]